MRQLPLVSTLAMVAASFTMAGCAATGAENGPSPVSQAAARRVPTQLPRTVRPLHYAINAVPDAANLSFTANTRIDVEVVEPTNSITLNAAELDFSSVTLTGADGGASQPTNIAMDVGKQTATFTFADTLAPGRYTLDIDYKGKINTQAAGFFALDYPTAEGEKRALFTQFEAPDARRFFPSWDEPDFRTPYDLTVTVPAGQMAVSNMPAKSTVRQADGSSVVTFQTTPPMSSYLLFLGMGEFDRITTDAAGTEVGVVMKKGDAEKGRYALEGAAAILPWYNQYFGTRFPLPKLDNVAGPGQSQFFGAMENWGAIFSFESILLVDPTITSEARRQSIFEVEAHEMAHQWFGDLVTMAWWDDLWLNEGFASWMATKATNALHPEWEPLLGRIDGREAAIYLDSVTTTHPIVQHVQTVEQISQAFDAITYQKGEAVLAMLEDYVGEDAWRRGVQDYIATYRLDNTQTDDLWGKVETAAGKPVTAIAHDFTLQPGVPLIRVENATCSGGNTTVSLRQGEFSRDNPDQQPGSWRVPVIAATVGGEPVRALVENGSASLSVPGCGALIVNSGQSGYYRTLYTPPLLDALTATYANLRPVDQIGLLADNWGLGLAGYQSAAEALDMLDAIPAGANAKLWTRAASMLGQIHEMYEGEPAKQALVAAYASRKLSPVLGRLGWEARADEPDTAAVLRAELIGTLGALGDKAVVAEANRRFDSGNPADVNGPLKTTLLAIVARNADQATWDKLHVQAKAEKSAIARTQLYELLGIARDEALARRALELALTDEPGATTSAGMIAAVASEHPELAYDFALAHRDRVMGLVDVSSASEFIPGLARGSSEPATVDKLKDYATRYMTAESRRPVDIAIASIQDRVRVRQERLPDITRWLQAHSS